MGQVSPATDPRRQSGRQVVCGGIRGRLPHDRPDPKWWIGRKFNKPTRGWIVGPTAQLVRDGPQRQLCARQGKFGTGTIPLASFAGKPVMVPGGTGSIDTLSTAHETDGVRDGIS